MKTVALLKRFYTKLQPFLQVATILTFILMTCGYFLIRSRSLNVINELDKEIALIQNTTIKFLVNVNKEIPVNISLKLSDIMDFQSIMPDSIHISDSFPVNESIYINQGVTTSVNIPVVGIVPITIPIEATIPVALTVPVDTNVDITDIQITDQDITIEENVPIDIDLEIIKNAEDLGLESHLNQIHTILNGLRLFFLSEPKEIPTLDDQTIQEIEVLIN